MKSSGLLKCTAASPRPEDESANICFCTCCSIILVKAFLIFLILTLRFVPSKPGCSINKFHINPVLYLPDSDSNYTTSTINNVYKQTIDFDLKLYNKEPCNGVYYDPLNLTFSYRPKTTSKNKTMSVIAEYGFPKFYQGYGKTAHRSSMVEAVLDGASNATTIAIFRVKLDTRVKFTGIWGTAKSQHLLVAGNFEVDLVRGEKVSKKEIELTRTSTAAVAAPCFVVVVLFSTAVISLLL